MFSGCFWVFSGVFWVFSGVFRCFQVFSGCFQVFSGCFQVFSGVLGCFHHIHTPGVNFHLMLTEMPPSKVYRAGLEKIPVGSQSIPGRPWPDPYRSQANSKQSQPILADPRPILSNLARCYPVWTNMSLPGLISADPGQSETDLCWSEIIRIYIKMLCSTGSDVQLFWRYMKASPGIDTGIGYYMIS